MNTLDFRIKMAGKTIVCIENMTNISSNNLEENINSENWLPENSYYVEPLSQIVEAEENLHSENSYYEESLDLSQIVEVESVSCGVSDLKVK